VTTPSGSPRAASSALAIKVRELSVVLGSSLILDDVSLAVGGGESVAILGANGSGKSTLVKAVLGLVSLSGGSIELLGTPTSRRHRVPWERVGYVPQRIGAGSGVPATALEVVRSGLLGPRRPWADRGRAAKRKAMAALDAVGLAHRAADHVQVFSGGQAQRVLIARALVRSPELLILDEPLAGIDRASRESLAEILQGLRAQGLTLVTVLHEMGELADVVQRAILLQDGRLVADGPAGEVAHLRDNGLIVDLSATLVGLRGHEASQVTRIGANDTDAVGPQSDSDELVAAILIGRGSQRLAILSGHRLSIRA